MLERVDRVQLVVKDRQAAARTFGEVLGAQPVREAPSAHLNAARLVSSASPALRSAGSGRGSRPASRASSAGP